jgi:hypothetical protein
MLLCHSTLSYGAASKSWTVTNSIKYSLQTFNHCSLHSILNINMYEVEEQWISHQCQDLKNVPTSKTSLSSSQEKNATNRLPHCLLATWVSNPRKKGCLQASLYNTMINLLHLQQALQDQVSESAPLSKWIETAQDEKL